MKRKDSKFNNKNIPIVFVIVSLLLILCGACIFVYQYSNNKLYNESVSQLKETGKQIFEKLNVQIDLQWSYLEKFEEIVNKNSSLSQEEMANLIGECEENLAPVGKTILFRAIDSDGYYYTSDGRQGLWSGADKLTDDDRESFLLSNWLDDDNYMVFACSTDKAITIDGKKIIKLALLRPMEEIKPFYTSSVLNNQNSVYIIDDEGTILFDDSNLTELNFQGKNIFTYLEEMDYPHIDNFEIIEEQSWQEEIVCTDVDIQNTKYYIVYNRMVDYTWGVLMIVPASAVAVSSTEMVNSLYNLFLVIIIILSITFITSLIFAVVIRQKREKEKLMLENEKQLREINSDLNKAKDKANEALVIAENATKAKSQFLANMSHDIRTPMNVILGVTKLMEHTVNDPDKQLYYINKLQSSGNYLLGLINDILDMSKIEANDVQLNHEPVKMAEQVGQIESIISSQANEKSQDFMIHVHNIAHEYVIGDSIRIRQIFLNLLTNAVKYTPIGGKIRFEISELPSDNPEYATFLTSVIDNGYGMSKEFLGHIFEPFTREINSTTNKIQGTGLGMSITKSLVDLMGGTITVESELNKGSRFDVTFTLPIDNNADRNVDIDSILLVSDEDLLIDNIKTCIKQTNIKLDVVSNLDEAKAKLKQEDIDAIILSGYYDMPVVDTVKLLREQVNKDILIFYCSYAYQELVGSGIDGVIARPFFYENLVLAIEHAYEDHAATKQKHIKSVLQGKRFLCAEDNELNVEILEALLDMHNASCTVCYDGLELVKMFENVKPGDYDAILMDMQMPNMNGIEATKAIRNHSNPLGKTIPIIAMTANAFSSDVEKCLEAGMNAHLAKPLDINALERVVQELIDGNGKNGGGYFLRRPRQIPKK